MAKKKSKKTIYNSPFAVDLFRAAAEMGNVLELPETWPEREAQTDRAKLELFALCKIAAAVVEAANNPPVKRRRKKAKRENG